MTSERALVVGPGHRHDDHYGPLLSAAALFDVTVDAITEYEIVHLRGDIADERVAELAERLLVDPVDGW